MEDRRTNRLVESMNIFETIVNNKLFLNVSIILFLNKTDLLVDKIRTVDIRKNFPEFRGDPRRLEDVQVRSDLSIWPVLSAQTLAQFASLEDERSQTTKLYLKLDPVRLYDVNLLCFHLKHNLARKKKD